MKRTAKYISVGCASGNDGQQRARRDWSRNIRRCTKHQSKGRLQSSISNLAECSSIVAGPDGIRRALGRARARCSARCLHHCRRAPPIGCGTLRRGARALGRCRRGCIGDHPARLPVRTCLVWRVGDAADRLAGGRHVRCAPGRRRFADWAASCADATTPAKER